MKKLFAVFALIMGNFLTTIQTMANPKLLQLEGEANYLSNYNGYDGDGDIDVLDSYDGDGDTFLSFNGGGNGDGSFNDEDSTTIAYQVTFKNTNRDAPAEFYLAPGLSKRTVDGVLADGVAKEGIFKDISGSQTMECTGITTSFNMLHNHFMRNPMRVVRFKCQASDAAVYNGMILKHTEESPLNATPQTRDITLSVWQSNTAFQDKILEVPQGFQLDDQSLIKLNLPANSSITFTFFMGATLNQAGALKAKAATAKGIAKRNKFGTK